MIGDEKGAADDDAMVNRLDEFDVDYVILARYMRILPAQTCWQFAGGRIINLHHGLLPGFPGFRPYHDAYNARMLTFGATCHFIIPELDAGNQTINQRTFSVAPGTPMEDGDRAGRIPRTNRHVWSKGSAASSIGRSICTSTGSSRETMIRCPSSV